MALGDIWLAGKGGSCENAGTCPDGGPCGDGVNDGDDCPAFWFHVAEFDVSYEPGGSVMIDGIPRNPGEVFAKQRGDLTVSTPLAYPVEYYRSEIETPDPIDWDPAEYQPATFSLICDPADSWGSPSPGSLFTDSPTGSGSGWPDPPGEPGKRYSGGGDLGFGPMLWIFFDSSLGYWVRKRRTETSITEKVIWGTGSMQVRRISDNALLATYQVTFSDNTPPGVQSPLPEDLISWAVLAYPNPRQTLVPFTNYGALPLVASPGEKVLQYGKFSFADQLRVNSIPTVACAGKIRLTIRSACENPPP